MLCMIYVPTFGKVSTVWAQHFFYMSKPLGNVAGEVFDPEKSASIADKRNNAVRLAIATGAKTLFFLGDDVHAPSDTLNLMLKRWREGAKAITGVYWTKTAVPEPYIYRGYMEGPYWDWKAGEYFPIDWAGCDCLLLDVETLKTIPDPWFSLDYEMSFANQPRDPSAQMQPWFQQSRTEDLYFFAKLKDAGVQLMCDSAIQCWHEDRNTGQLFGLCDGMPQKTRIPQEVTGKLIADIGCGRTTNPLYQENTLHRFDSDEEAKPDFRCDVRTIPAADNVYDLAIASHVLEHLEIKDVVPALKEWVRIVKPGGILTVKVPNLSYAAKAIAEDGVFGHDPRWKHPYELLMVYGSQDGPGMYHKSGFTRSILQDYATQALAEICDIVIEGTQPINECPTELTMTATKRVATEPLKRVADSFIRP